MDLHIIWQINRIIQIRIGLSNIIKLVPRPRIWTFTQLNEFGRDMFLGMPQAQIKRVFTAFFLEKMVHNNQYVCKVELWSLPGNMIPNDDGIICNPCMNTPVVMTYMCTSTKINKFIKMDHQLLVIICLFSCVNNWNHLPMIWLPKIHTLSLLYFILGCYSVNTLKVLLVLCGPSISTWMRWLHKKSVHLLTVYK